MVLFLPNKIDGFAEVLYKLCSKVLHEMEKNAKKIRIWIELSKLAMLVKEELKAVYYGRGISDLFKTYASLSVDSATTRLCIFD